MASSTSSYTYLINKIDEFTRKYYLNKIVRGTIYLASTLFASYILVTLAEYYGNFSPAIRTLLFYSFIGLNLFIIIKWIAIPLLSYLRLGKTISHEQASLIIGQHFGDVKDKLLNTLQLKKLADDMPHQRSLIDASINQKMVELQPVPFTSAVRIQENRRYLKYALVPLAVILIIAFSAPSIFSESTRRLIKYNEAFVKKAPFQFIILNNKLSAIEGDDYTLKVKLTGNEIPQDIYLEDGVNSFKLTKENIINFTYTFKNLQQTKKIRLQAGEFSSDDYVLEVKRKPTLLNFDVLLEYPSYVGKQNETVSNSGDLTVPAGTRITWKFKTQNTSNIDLKIDNRMLSIKPSADNLFNYSFRAMDHANYTVMPVNHEVANHDSMSYKIDVIPDLSPAIEVNERPDSIDSRTLYFVGQVSDDYGFSKLNFHYKILDKDKAQSDVTKAISFDKNALQSNFFYVWNAKEVNAEPGQQIEYYFEIYDNDGVHGAKVTRSSVKTFNLPTQEEVDKAIENSSKAVEQNMEQAIRQASQLEKEAKKIAENLLNKRELSYEEKKQVEQLLQKQKDLEELVKKVQKDNKKNLFDQQQNREQSQEMLQKQKQIEDLFNNVLDEKTKELLKSIEKLLNQNNKNQTQQQLNKMQVDNKSLQKELDRILELYKQLAFDQKLTESIDKLKELAKEQQKLSDQSEQKNANAPEIKENQEKLNEEFKGLKEDLKELEEKNEELSDKNDFKNPEKETQQIEQQQEQSSKNLDNKSMKKAAENQENAAEEMEKLAEKMEQAQQENEQKENMVNMESLREILDNLVKTSFDQEKVMQTLKNTRTNDPSYVSLSQRQKDIQENLKMIQDSLYSLSKRAPQIQSVINKEIADINFNVGKSLEYLGDRRTAEANRNQQYSMTSINNLALMLSEVEEQMQSAMKNAKPGKKPGKSASELRQMQEKLNQNMQKAREQMAKEGQQPGQGQKGKEGQGKEGQQGQGQQPGQGQGKGQMSEELARMAREQQMIRQGLQELNREMNKDGTGSLGDLDKLTKEMEQTETDLVNKKIQQETLIRQQDILTKLLDAEKAEREQEQDDKRESKQGKDMTPNYKIVLEEYKKIKQRETELLKTVPPSLNTFYRIKVGDYFKFLNSGK